MSPQGDQVPEAHEVNESSEDTGIAFPDPIIPDAEPAEGDEPEVPPVEEAAPHVLPGGELPQPPIADAAIHPLPDIAPPLPVPPQPTYQPVPPQAYQQAPVAPPPSQEPYTFYTEYQLQAMVDEGRIDDNQKAARVQEQQYKMIDQGIREQARESSITQQLNEYRRLAPGWDQIGTQVNQAVQPAYSYLLGLGMPESNATRLLALEKTYGTLDRIKSARSAQQQTAELRNTAKAVGRRPAAQTTKSKKDPLSILAPDELILYKEEIEKGKYSDWNAVRKELVKAANNKTNPHLRAKHAGVLS